jgi:hypothetical protein
MIQITHAGPHKPLPVLVRAKPDELLSSWLRRCAEIYSASTQDLLQHMGLGYAI